MKSSSKFDIVVYGATGFTGQLVAEYLAAHYKDDRELKWAMAGRSLDKLKSVRDAIGAPADTPLIAADAGDAAFAEGDGRADQVGADDGRPVSMVWQRVDRGVRCVGHRLSRSLRRAGLDAADDRQARGGSESERRAHPVLLRLRFGAVRARRLLRAGRSETRLRRAGRARQGPRARHARHVFRRHRGERARNVRSRLQGSQPGGDPERSLCADARFQGREAAERQQAGLRRGHAILDRAVHDGADQHAQYSSLQHADGFSLREGVRLRRDGADGPRRAGRGQRQKGDGGEFREDRPERSQAGRGPLEGRAGEWPLRPALCRGRARRPRGPHLRQGRPRSRLRLDVEDHHRMRDLPGCATRPMCRPGSGRRARRCSTG